MRELQWSFSNKTTNAPQILSFKSAGQDGGSSTPQTPPGFVQGKGKGKGNVSFDKQAGKKQCPAAAAYGQQQHNETNTSSISQPHEARCNPETSRHVDRRLPAPKNKGILHRHNFSSPEGQDSPCSNCKPQSIAAKPLAAPVPSVPANCPIVGSTHLSNTIKSSGGPSQFTIFYDGLVCVYDDVSPEKAQAIMLLAGNGNPPTHSKSMIAPVPPKVRPPVSRPQSADGTNNAGNCSGHSSPICMLPPPNTCSGSTSTAAAAANPVKPAVTIIVPSSAADHVDLSSVTIGSPRPICEVNQGNVAISSKAPVRHPAEIHGFADSAGAATGAKDRPEVSPVVSPPTVDAVPSGAAPLTRKASLARFLERRKERVVRASPYGAANNTSECITTNKGDAAK